MDSIAQRDLRNDISDILRRVEGGEAFVVTVGGRPVAELIPYDRRRWVPRAGLEQLFTTRAPQGLLDDLGELGGGEMNDPFAQEETPR